MKYVRKANVGTQIKAEEYFLARTWEVLLLKMGYAHPNCEVLWTFSGQGTCEIVQISKPMPTLLLQKGLQKFWFKGEW